MTEKVIPDMRNVHVNVHEIGSNTGEFKRMPDIKFGANDEEETETLEAGNNQKTSTEHDILQEPK